MQGEPGHAAHFARTEFHRLAHKFWRANSHCARKGRASPASLAAPKFLFAAARNSMCSLRMRCITRLALHCAIARLRGGMGVFCLVGKLGLGGVLSEGDFMAGGGMI